MREERDGVQHKNFDPKVWARMLPLIKPYRRQVVGVAVLMLLIAGVDIALPLFMRFAVDHFIVPRSTDGLGRYIALYGGVVLLQGLFVLLFSRMCLEIEMLLGKDLKRKTFVHLQQLSFSYYNVTPVGYLLARVMSDTNRIAGVIAWSALDLFWSAFYVVGVFIAMLILNLRLALIVILAVPVMALLTALFQGRILVANRRIRRINSEITGAYNEGITGAKTSKTLVIEERNSREFAGITGRMYSAVMRSTLLSAVFIPLVTFFCTLAAAGVLAEGGAMVMGGVIEFGLLYAFVAYALGILEPVQQMARVLSDFVSCQANIERVFGLLDHPVEIKDSPEVVEKYGDAFSPKRENWPPLRGDITFEHVWFKYPDGDEYVLEDFSLHIPAGTNMAIVGETGAGKSTLVNLACRFFEPTRGRILIDGVDCRERSQLWLHSHLGYVLQNPHLFAGTVEENIRYGNLEASREQVERAAALVSADQVIARLENGYQTNVGENGDRLSTGEKQLVSFARAVLADPRIFVLDEATSSVDTETEQLIQNAIAHILTGRTSFLIAHRLSTVRQADLILVVRQGKIIQRGTHQELMAQDGYYRTLYHAMIVREKEAGMFSAREDDE